MSDSPHRSEAVSFLQGLSESLEVNLPANWDIDLSSNDLTITSNTGSVFLVTLHGTSGQIWLSSPLTGAHHFQNRDGDWFSTRTNLPLTTVLYQDLAHLIPGFPGA